MRLRALDKELRFAAGLMRRRPFNCLVQVTNRCNMRCGFCGFWQSPAKPTDELSLRDFERISEELAELGCFLVSIEGGEPFVRKDLIDIVRVLSRRHITALFTNGWYVTPQKARALFDAGLTHANVSIDFVEANAHDDKRGQPGAFDRALRAVRFLRDAAELPERQVNIMTVLMRGNSSQLSELVSLSSVEGVGHYFTLLSRSGAHRVADGEVEPDPHIAAELCRLWDAHGHVRFFRSYFERMDPFLSGGPMPVCRAGAQSFNVDHVGNISACIERIDEPVGNVRDASVVTLHRRLIERADSNASCQRCWTACRGLHQAMGDGGSVREWLDMARRARTG